MADKLTSLLGIRCGLTHQIISKFLILIFLYLSSSFVLSIAMMKRYVEDLQENSQRYPPPPPPSPPPQPPPLLLPQVEAMM